MLVLSPTLLAYVLAACVIVEPVFAIHGAGDLVAQAASARDAPMLIGAAAITAFIVSVTSSTVDLVNRRLDPRRAVS